MFLGKDVLEICRRFTWEDTCRCVISIKLLCNFIEIALRHGCSPVNLRYIFRAPFPKNTSGRLLLWVLLLRQNHWEIIMAWVKIFFIFQSKFHCVKSVQTWSFFWSLFSCIRTEYGYLLRKSSYLVWIQEKTNQRKLRIWSFFMKFSI